MHQGKAPTRTANDGPYDWLGVNTGMRQGVGWWESAAADEGRSHLPSVLWGKGDLSKPQCAMACARSHWSVHVCVHNFESNRVAAALLCPSVGQEAIDTPHRSGWMSQVFLHEVVGVKSCCPSSCSTYGDQII